MPLNTKKIRLLVGITLIIVAILLIVIIFFLNPEKPDTAFDVKIFGEVHPINDSVDLSKRPTSISVYLSPNNPNNLCDGESADIYPAKINWLNDGTSGTFNFSYNVPIDMGITLTADCSSCLSTTFYLHSDQREYFQNVSWDGASCRDILEEYDNPEKAFSRAVSFLASTGESAESSFDRFNDSDSIQTRRNLAIGWRNIAEIGDNFNWNSALLPSYRAIVSAWIGQYYLDRYQLKTCLNEFNTLTVKSEGCYYPTASNLIVYRNSNTTYYSARLFNDYDVYEKNMSTLKNDISWIWSQRNSMRQSTNKCQRALSNSWNEFEAYSNKCSTESKINFLIGGLTTIFVTLIGFFTYLLRNLDWIQALKGYFKKPSSRIGNQDAGHHNKDTTQASFWSLFHKGDVYLANGKKSPKKRKKR